MSPLLDLAASVVISHSMRAAIFALLTTMLSVPAVFAAEIYEPKAGSAERKAIMEAMRGPVSKFVGERVTFTGQVQVLGNWATFHGGVETTSGKKPVDEDKAFELELDFFALLGRDRDGNWKALHWGFAGDIGVMQEAREKYPKAPKALFSILRE